MSNTIILNLAMSLDGFIADADGGYDWIATSGDSHLNTNLRWSHERFLEHVAVIVMGKRCYDQQFHSEYKNKQVYVITSQKLSDYENIHFISPEEACAEVHELKQKANGDIYFFRGGITTDPILKAGLIDEYIIGIIPVILGNGIPLFLQGNPTVPLYLTHHYVEDGVVILRYIPRKSADKAN